MGIRLRENKTFEIQAEGKTIGFSEVRRGIDVTKDNRKIFCGIIKVLDPNEHEIATVACLPDVTLVKFPDGNQKILRSPLDSTKSVIFFDEEHFETIIAAAFSHIIANNKDDEQKMMQELKITCASPLKHSRAATTVPIKQEHDNSSAEQRVRKFPPDFSLN